MYICSHGLSYPINQSHSLSYPINQSFIIHDRNFPLSLKYLSCHDHHVIQHHLIKSCVALYAHSFPTNVLNIHTILCKAVSSGREPKSEAGASPVYTHMYITHY